ncbi:MAG: CpXC domain-containing protein [Armatimonadetes bacterium]|nr:CpXC domain-containing protein [Anaerolineae bacterium]
MTIRCTACGQPYPTAVRNYIDTAQDPQGKALLLAGQLNASQCPHCNTVNAVAAPLLYHDASKELLVALVPMELSLNKDQTERAIGDLMKALPKADFKGYMFSPKRALTMQGLMEMVLQADGITPAMMEQQRQRVALIQALVESPDATLPDVITQNDAQIDLQFFQTMGVMAQRLAQNGRGDVAERIVQVQQVLLEFSSFGKGLLEQQAQQASYAEELAQEVEVLGEDATRADFLALARKYADDNGRLQALVGIVRPVFDAQFFEELTVGIGQAPSAERADLETLRDKLMELTQMLDEQTQRQVQSAVGLLQALLNTDPAELDAHLQDSLPLINDTFMAVLTANIEEAERRRDQTAMSRLREIYERVVALLQASMQPELLFVNQLLSLDNPAEAQALLQQHAHDFGEPLLDVIDALGEVLNAQGNWEMVQRLTQLRQDAMLVLGQ